MQWNFFNLESVSERSTTGTPNAEKIRSQLESLETRLESLTLACQAMWEMLRDETNVTEEQLEAKMEEIDLRDGTKDGKLSASVGTCRTCGRKTTRRRKTCIYCGTSHSSGEVFGIR